MRTIFDFSGNLFHCSNVLWVRALKYITQKEVQPLDHRIFLDSLELHGDTVTRILLLRCRQPEDAQDCFQSVFLKLLTHGRDDWDQEHIKAWLIRTAIHEAASVNRQFWCRNVTLQGDTSFPDQAAPEGGAGRELLDELRSLPEHQREVLYLHYYEGYSIDELADILGVRPGTVKSRLSRAREALKTQLKTEGYTHEMGSI